MRSLMKQLYRWRFRERVVHMVWGAARLLAVMAVVLAFCCIVDFWVDMYRDVPGALRFGMLAFQAIVAAVLGYFFLVRTWFATPPVDDYASRAEKAIPEFDHRLVTAIQLNRAHARTEGMSPALIAEVTREAGEMAARHNLSRLIDYSRLAWSGMILLPILLFWSIFLLFFPSVVVALLQRQALFDVEIPRSIRLANTTVPLWPAGDSVTVQYEVTGKFREKATGTVYVYPEGQPKEKYPLTFHSVIATGKALYTATIPQSSANFTFEATLSDARTRDVGSVRFEARPAIASLEAWTVLPEYLGVIPTGPKAGQRYERLQPQGEVLALPGSDIRIHAVFEKPVAKAELILMEPVNRADKIVERRLMKLAPDRRSADDLFTLTPNLHLYRIELTDDHGFKNLAPPQRGLIHLPDEPPHVELLQEAFKNPDPTADDGKGPIEDYEFNGIPIIPGSPFQVAFNARSRMGIGQVWLYYRVNDEAEKQFQHQKWSLLGLPLEFRAEVEVPKWYTQLLKPVRANNLGPFVPELGLFQKSGTEGQVELYKIPSSDPETEPGELEAGGKFDFFTGGLRKTGPDGKPAKLEPGDRVEFYVAASDKVPGANRPRGRSESRIKGFVTAGQLDDWNRQRDQSRDRLKESLEKQRAIPFSTAPK